MSKASENPKVTIVIPVYNGAKYVKYAIDSALAQTYKNLEILVVNDGSTDKTDEIVRTYGDKVRYIKKENGGVSSALNLAIKKMKGEYFSWLSHDDIYEPNKIEREVEFLRQNNYLGKKVIVFSDYFLIDKNGKFISEAKKNHEETIEKPEYNLLKGHINGLSLLIPKKAFDEYGDFDIELSCVQDYDMWHRMMKTYKFVHIPETLVSTRWHKEQTTQTSPKVITEGNAFCRKLLDEISEGRMEKMEGSKYFLLKEMARFYRGSAYDEFSKECNQMANEIFDAAKYKTKDKKVSVVVPFFNRNKETQRAVRSILNQTHKNFEIILVNDGSTENINVIRRIAEENKDRIVFIDNKKNRGASVARNEGIRVATGDYIAFLDSDDEFAMNKLEVQLQYMVATKAKISHTSYDRINEKGERKYINSGVEDGYCAEELVSNCMIAMPTVMIDRYWLKQKEIFFNATMEIGEDTCFWLELLKYNKTFLVGIEKPLTTVYTSSTSAINDAEKQLIGLKTIIGYLLTDEYYRNFDDKISRLMEAYMKYVRKVKALRVPEPFAGNNILQKLIFFVRQEGIVNTGRRIRNKIISSKSEN